MPDFTIAVQTVTASQTIVRLSGSPGPEDLAALEEAFANVLGSPATTVLVDASGLDSVSAAALGAMVDLAAQLARRAGKVAMAVPGEELRGLIDLLGLSETLSVAGNMDEARRLATAK